ncbi:MAG: chitobiase/beta-hexosaminidase C-terminal domain-containing protein, partial [Muribaculaceae bacterium]|nr:chitobiase/beta-hexosaminidase C-terminal domain-containing protein [Muribaculaceae bacterium]
MSSRHEDWVKRYSASCAISIDGVRRYTTQTKRPRCRTNDATTYTNLLNTPSQWESTLWGTNEKTDTLYFYPNKSNINTWAPYYHNDYDYVDISLSKGTHTMRVTSLASQWVFDCIEMVSQSDGPAAPATPTFSPAGGTYTSAQNVTISCSTSGAEIRYTLNGSTPTTSSALYSAAIPISETTTIKAIAVKDGQTSSVASATYTINTSPEPPIDPSQFVFTKVYDSKNDVVTSGDGRYSTGYGGYLYLTDKSSGTIYKYDINGNRSTAFTGLTGIGSAISTDDAGNFLVNKGFSGAGSGSNWMIIEPNGTTHDITLDYGSSGVSAARTDAVGRVLGNMMSSAGAYFCIIPNGSSSAAIFKIVNGAQSGSPIAVGLDWAADATTIAQPYATSVSAVASNPAGSFMYRKRGNKSVTTKALTRSTSDGFDVFTLGNKTYLVEPTGTNYCDGYTIHELGSDDVVAEKTETVSSGSQRFQSLTARVSEDGTYAYIYQNVSGYNTSIYRFGMPSTGIDTIGTDVVEVGHVYYNLQGVRIDK